jgi:hypothetical protein
MTVKLKLTGVISTIRTDFGFLVIERLERIERLS